VKQVGDTDREQTEWICKSESPEEIDRDLLDADTVCDRLKESELDLARSPVLAVDLSSILPVTFFGGSGRCTSSEK
jgi:hypothetical protein